MKKATYFELADPFNPQNYLKGFVIIGGGGRYGMLHITEINGVTTDQYIFGTPKLSYPFDQDGKFHFPKIRAVGAYTKLDGTNIVAYRYEFRGEKYITYKTRLRPFLSNNYGEFYSMWNRMLTRYENIPALFDANPTLDAFSFELYGNENTHLIHYDFPLDTALLFGLEGSDVVSLVNIDAMDVPTASLESVVVGNYVENYQQNQTKMEEGLTAVDANYTGQEGQVWYAFPENPKQKVILWKCKPETIEKIHWSSSEAIHRNIIRTTAYNALESYEELTHDNVVSLLEEEFSGDIISKSKSRIEKIVNEINDDMAIRQQVISHLDKLNGETDVTEMNIGDVMRHLVQFFDKKQNKRVFHNAQRYMQQLVDKTG